METITRSPVVKRRSPRVASFLSSVMYGLGHIYCGHFVRGLVIYAMGITIFAATIAMMALMKGRFLQALLIGLGSAIALGLFARFDARRLAARAPAEYVLKD